MKLSIPLVLSFFASVAKANDFYDEEDRELFPFFGGGRGGGMRGGQAGAGAGGGFPFGPPPVPEEVLDCSEDIIETCTPRRPGATFEEDSGIRVCLQHPEKPDKNITVCMPATDDMVMVFSTMDSCGCCGGECPVQCDETTACPCEGTGRDDEPFSGYTMTMTRRGWFGGEATISTCVPAAMTISAQLRGASCTKADECN